MTAVSGCASYGKGRAAAPVAQPAAAASSAATSVIARVAGIPVGGGTILADRQLVVIRPTADEVRVLGAVCTHQGCTVDTVANGTISCPRHGSTFSLTGEVTSGPATTSLPAQAFSVADGVVSV